VLYFCSSENELLADVESRKRRLERSDDEALDEKPIVEGEGKGRSACSMCVELICVVSKNDNGEDFRESKKEPWLSFVGVSTCAILVMVAKIVSIQNMCKRVWWPLLYRWWSRSDSDRERDVNARDRSIHSERPATFQVVLSAFSPLPAHFLCLSSPLQITPGKFVWAIAALSLAKYSSGTTRSKRAVSSIPDP
jgi:hypothetical protein